MEKKLSSEAKMLATLVEVNKLWRPPGTHGPDCNGASKFLMISTGSRVHLSFFGTRIATDSKLKHLRA